MKLQNNIDAPISDLKECSLECLLKLSTLLLKIPCSAVALQVEKDKWNHYCAGDEPVATMVVQEMFEKIISADGYLEEENYFGVKLDLNQLETSGLLVLIKQPERSFSSLEKELIAVFKSYIEIQLSLQNIETRFNEQGEMLIQKSRLATLGQMATEIVHEINNPITVIHARLEMLMKQTKNASISKDEVLESLNKILANTVRVEHMIKDIKTFSRFSEQDPFVDVAVSEMLNYS